MERPIEGTEQASYCVVAGRLWSEDRRGVKHVKEKESEQGFYKIQT
jgi:hypothetical protein